MLTALRGGRIAQTFCGPGLQREDAIPLVAGLPVVEISSHPLLEAVRSRTGPISHRALELAEALAQALPAAAVERPQPQIPGLWEGFRYEFARFSLAPALINLEIARHALQGSGVQVARVRELRSGAWWLGGAGAAEAVAEAARETGAQVQLHPGQGVRALRRALQGYTARRAPRPTQHCHDCEVLPQEQLTDAPCEVLFLGVAATSVPFITHLSASLEQRGLRCAALDLHFAGSTRLLRRTDLRVIDGRPAGYGGEQAEAEFRQACAGWLGQSRARLGQLTATGRLPAWLAPLAQLRLAVTVERDLPQIAAFRQMAQVVLDTLRPQLVVGFHLSADFLAPFVLGAQARGIATACLQHGLRGPAHRSGVMLPWDSLLAFGPYTEDLYRDLTPEGSRWLTTGNCLYDRLLTAGLPAGGPARERLGLGEGPVVLAATQSDEPEVKAAQSDWWLRGVAAACELLRARLIVKLHPIETDPGLYEDLLRDYPDTVQLFTARELDLREALAAADVLVTRDSTVVYEAALAGKPTLTVNLAPYGPRFPLAEHGGAAGVTEYQEILRTLSDLLEDGPAAQRLAQQREGFVQYHLGPQDAQASERTVAALAEMAGH